MERSITVRVDVIQDSRWVEVIKTGGSAEQFRPLIMELGGKIAAARGDLCRARRKLGAALLQIKQQTPYGEWTSFLKSLEVNEKTLRNAIALVERLCDVNGEFVEAKMTAARLLRPAVQVGDTRRISLIRAEELAGIRPVRHVPPNTEFGTRVPLSEIGGSAGERTNSEFGTVVPNSDSVRIDLSDVGAGFEDDDDEGDLDDVSLDDTRDPSWQPGQQMTFEDLRAASLADATRLCGLLAQPDADPDLVQRFHDWAQRELV